MIRLQPKDIPSYLTEHGLISSGAQKSLRVTTPARSTLNSILVVDIGDTQTWMIKQQKFTKTTLLHREAQFYQWLSDCNSCTPLKDAAPKFVFFDTDNAILIIEYFRDYEDVLHYQKRLGRFPVGLSRRIAWLLAQIHRHSFLKSSTLFPLKADTEQSPPYVLGAYTTPEAFYAMPIEGANVLSLIQGYWRLDQVIYRVLDMWRPICLIHKDLKLDNILKQRTPSRIPSLKIVDWELNDWGDPAWDVASVIGSYLDHWLSSVRVQASSSFYTWFTEAQNPLDRIRPAIVAFWREYIDQCDVIVQQRPDFASFVMQCTGLFLLERVRSSVFWSGSLSSHNIHFIQVANTLLTQPEVAAELILESTK